MAKISLKSKVRVTRLISKKVNSVIKTKFKQGLANRADQLVLDTAHRAVQDPRYKLLTSERDFRGHVGVENPDTYYEGIQKLLEKHIRAISVLKKKRNGSRINYYILIRLIYIDWVKMAQEPEAEFFSSKKFPNVKWLKWLVSPGAGRNQHYRIVDIRNRKSLGGRSHAGYIMRKAKGKARNGYSYSYPPWRLPDKYAARSGTQNIISDAIERQSASIKRLTIFELNRFIKRIKASV